MVTGRRAWKRNSAAETLTAIIREDPEPIAAAAPDTPIALRWIVDRCLAKDPEERYSSTRDLARDLATVRDHLSEISGVEFRSEIEGRHPPGRRLRRALLIAAVGVMALAAGILLAPLLRVREKSPPLPNWVQIGFRRGVIGPGASPPTARRRLQRGVGRRPGQNLLDTDAVDGNADLDLPASSGHLPGQGRLAFLRDASFARFFIQPGTLVRSRAETARDATLENVHAAAGPRRRNSPSPWVAGKSG
jgi:hypothetical protein